ncbi:hypothetical protein BU204_28685 [Actinophytocola xanthii]|uniref:Uncharacterized protein n=1 Tax=Actinophytocola xanthii TaxID=1912961 RepID=A0A1Q8CE16_9PSEU|nr:hypothetical protein BU204_28685 [Actinophytocola xanthii]
MNRRAFGRSAARLGVGVAVGSVVVGLSTVPAAAATDGFRWCRRCQSLWFVDGGDNGHCPVTHLWDHSHYRDASGAYVLRRDVEPGAGQTGWHWCEYCKAVFYSGQGELGWGRCPNDPSGFGAHWPGDREIAPGGQRYVSFRMETETRNNGAGAQAGWRFCFRCNGMFFAFNGLPATHCPTGGRHDDSRSDRYLMRFG